MFGKQKFRKIRTDLMVTTISSIAAFSSAQAATLYEGDGFTYNVNGDLQVQFRQKIGENKKLDLEFDDLELKNRVDYELNDNLTVFGELDYSFDKEANNQG